MSFFRKLQFLLPRRRRNAEQEMLDELESLKAIAGTRELGNLTLIAEDVRRVWTWIWLEHLMQDLRYAFRSMIRNRSFVAVAALSLALGIGANTAIYSFMESVLLRSLPVPHPESLVVMKWRTRSSYASSASKGFSFSTDGSYSDPKGGFVGTQFPYPALKFFQSKTDVLSSAFAYFVASLNVTIRQESEVLKTQYVSGNFFSGLGVSPAAGRLILTSDDADGSAAVAVLSYRMSRRQFGDVRQAVGQSIRINDKLFSVIGVAPPDFFGAEPGYTPDVFVPLRAQFLLESPGIVRMFSDPNWYWIEIMGRLKPGVDMEEGQAILASQFNQFVMESTSTENERKDLPALTLYEGAAGLDTLRRQYSRPIYILMAMAGLILLIACANIANLLLARASARSREIAVRMSIGAGRVRIIRQLLTESLLLLSVGGVAGVLFAVWGIRALTLMLARGRENFTLHAELNWHVIGIAILLSIVTGLLFGLAPALRATRVDVAAALKQVRAGLQDGTVGRNRVSLGRVLIAAQIAFSLLLLVVAGLFSRTLSHLHSIEVGFKKEEILTFRIRPRAVGYQGPALHQLYDELRERIAAIPGVRNVSSSTQPIPSGGGTMAPVAISGANVIAPAQNGRPPNYAVLFSVGPAFFSTMQIAVIAGRDFEERDGLGAPPVAIVNRRLASVFGLDNPVGRTLTLGLGGRDGSYEIVGVATDALGFQLKENQRPILYRPYKQDPQPPFQVTFEIRAAGDLLSHAATVREIVRQVDWRVAVSDLKTEAAFIDEGISQEITFARLSSAFAFLALVIACIGIYGTVTFNVTRRTTEIGVRMALGARRGLILWLVMWDVVALALAGIAIGVPFAVAFSRYVRSLLFGIEPGDAVSMVVAVGVLLIAGLTAGYIPARRASRIDPVAAMRHE